MVRRAAVPDHDRRIIGRRPEVHAAALNADYARPVAVLRRRQRVCLAALHFRTGGEPQRKERRRRRLAPGYLVGGARRGSVGAFAEIRLYVHCLPGRDGDAHDIHEAGVFVRRCAPHLPRRGGNAEERLRPGVCRMNHIDIATHKCSHRRGHLVIWKPHVVGNRLLVDRRSVIRYLARVGVGFRLIGCDARDGRTGEKVFAHRARRRRFKIDCVPPLLERHRFHDVRRLRRERHKRHKGQKRQVSGNLFHNFKLSTSNFKL